MIGVLASAGLASGAERPIGAKSAGLKRELSFYRGDPALKASFDLRSVDSAIALDPLATRPDLTGAQLIFCDGSGPCPDARMTTGLPAENWRVGAGGFSYSAAVPVVGVPNPPKVMVVLRNRRLKIRALDWDLTSSSSDGQMPAINCCATGPYMVILRISSTDFCVRLPDDEVASDRRFRFTYRVRNVAAPDSCAGPF